MPSHARTTCTSSRLRRQCPSLILTLALLGAAVVKCLDAKPATANAAISGQAGHQQSQPARTAVYMRPDSEVLDLQWDKAPKQLLRQLKELGLKPLEVKGVSEADGGEGRKATSASTVAAALRALPSRSAYLVPAQNGPVFYTDVEDMQAVAAFLKAGGLVVLLDANDGDAESARLFISAALQYKGGWTSCKVTGDNSRNRLGAPELSAQHAHSFLPSVASASSSFSTYSDSDSMPDSEFEWPARLEDARMTRVHSWCHSEDADALSWPLYTAGGNMRRVSAQAFGKSGVPGAIVWLGYSWRDGPRPEWGALLHKLISDFAAGLFTPSSSSSSSSPSSDTSPDTSSPASSVDTMLDAVPELAESTVELIRRFLADGAVPAAYPPPPPPSPSPPDAACVACQSCLSSMIPVAAAALATANATSRASAFLTACTAASFSTPACNSLATTILSGTNNIAARAGMLCSSLAACSPSSCASLTAVRLDGTAPAVLSGGLDLCAAEGIVGGTATALPTTAATGPASCRTSADCAAAGGGGGVCQFANDGNGGASSQQCECAGGVDVCRNIGTCTAYCSLNSTLATVASLNAGSTSCDASDAASVQQCGAAEECTAVAGCLRWGCDAASQQLVQLPCSGKCQPLSMSPLTAQIANDGQSVAVALSASAAPLSLVACGGIFDAASTAALGGSEALCSASGAVLTARLTPAATLMAGQKLSFLASGSALVSQLDSRRSFNGSVTVASCAACAVPQPVVTGPSTVTTQPCVAINSLLQSAPQPPVFDASLSSDPSGRAAWAQVQWSLVAGYGNAASRAVLQGAVDRANAMASTRDRLRLSLASSEVSALEVASEYRFQVVLTSWLGTSASSLIGFTTNSTVTRPVVRVVGPTTQTFKISNGLRASALAESPCTGQSLQWLWTSPSGWSGLPAGGLVSQQLYVPAADVPAAHGQTIDLRVTAHYGSSATATSVDMTFLALGSEPVVSLAGPASDVPDDTPLLLNASASYDPDTATRALQRLIFKWSCVREDYPAPCFSSSARGDAESTPGLWSLPAGLLSTGKWHTFTVTVAKEVSAGAPVLEASSSVTFRPRDASEKFPRGSLTRQCAGGGSSCTAPHSTDTPLTVMLTVAAGYTNSSVRWSSPELPSLAGTAAAATADSSSGLHFLTIPASELPANRPSVTLTATMTTPGGVSAQAMLTVPLNSAPYCGLSGSSAAADAAACIAVEALDEVFPTAAFVVRAQGWADGQDSQLRYEFGVRESRGNGRSVDQLQQTGSSSSVTLMGLSQGSVTLYGCAVDSQGSRTCAVQTVTVKPPAAGFDAVAAAAALDVDLVVQWNDANALLHAGNTLASLLLSSSSSSGNETTGGSTTGGSDSAALAQVADKQSVAIVNAILDHTSMTDPEQAQRAIAVISAIASSASASLSDTSRGVMLEAAKSAASFLAADASTDTLSEICQLLGVSMPTAANGTAAAGSRRRTRLAAVDAVSTAHARLRDLLDVSDKLGDALGSRAVPGAGFLAAGDGGVFVSAAALVAPAAADGSNARTSVQLRAGPEALAASAGASTRRRTMRATSAAAKRRGLKAAATAVSSAEADLVLSGAAASGAVGYGIDLSYAPSAAAALSTALAASLPASATLLPTGLTTVTWNAVPGVAAAAAPSLDGSASYLLVHIPAPGYDAAKTTSCLSYDVTANTVSNGSSGGAAAATFMSYDSATGLATCRTSAAGSYVLTQTLSSPIQNNYTTNSNNTNSNSNNTNSGGGSNIPPSPYLPNSGAANGGSSGGESGLASTATGSNSRLVVLLSVICSVVLFMVVTLTALVIVIRRRRQRDVDIPEGSVIYNPTARFPGYRTPDASDGGAVVTAMYGLDVIGMPPPSSAMMVATGLPQAVSASTDPSPRRLGSEAGSVSTASTPPSFTAGRSSLLTRNAPAAATSTANRHLPPIVVAATVAAASSGMTRVSGPPPALPGGRPTEDCVEDVELGELRLVSVTDGPPSPPRVPLHEPNRHGWAWPPIPSEGTGPHGR